MGGFSTAVMPPNTRGFEITPPDPYANLRALAMQGQVAEQKQNILGQQQQMRGEAIKQQAAQQQLDDQRAFGEALREWDPASGTDALLHGALNKGMVNVLPYQQHFAQLRLTNAQANEADLKTQQTKHDAFAGQMQAVIDAPVEQKQALYDQYRPLMMKEQDANDTPLPAPYQGDVWGAGQVKGHQLLSESSKQELERRQGEEAGAKASQAKAEAGKAQAETERTQAINDLLKQAHQAPANGQHPIDAVLPASLDPQMNAVYKAQYDNGARFINPTTGISSVQEDALRGAAGYAHEISKANNEKIRAGEAATAGAKATAEIPAHVAAGVQTEIGKAKLAPDAFSGIIDPMVRQRAMAAYDTADKAYREKEADAQRLQTFVDQARAGNQTATGLAGITLLREIVSRVTNQEIGQIGNGVSIMRRLQNVIEKGAEGKPSEATLSDYEALGKGILAANKRAYSAAAMRIQSYGGKVPLEPAELPAAKSAAAPGRQPGDKVTLRNGKTVTIKAVHPDGSFDAE